MKAIVYISDAILSFKPREVAQLAIESANANSALEITGYLCFHKHKFFQYIEGNEEVISALMFRIERDYRHEVLRIFEDPNLHQRRFANWSMRHLEMSPNIGVRVEDVIHQHFLLIESGAVSEQRWVQLIWNAVGSLADIQNRLVAQPRS